MTRSIRVVATGLQLLVAGPLFAQQTTPFTVGTATAALGRFRRWAERAEPRQRE